MALIDNCILHTLENDSPSIVTPSIPGTAIGTANGTLLYQPGKFDNGSNDNNNIANFFNYPGASLKRPFNQNLCIFEIWMDTNAWTCTNGNHSKSGILNWFNWFRDTSNYLIIRFQSGLLNILNRVSATTKLYQITTGLTFDSTLHHFLIMFDRGGIGIGSDTFRLYMDASLIASSTLAYGNQANSAGDLYFHGVHFSGVMQATAIDALLDNTKMYDDNGAGNITEQLIIDILANRNNEGFPSAGGFRLIDGGMKSPLINNNMIN